MTGYIIVDPPSVGAVLILAAAIPLAGWWISMIRDQTIARIIVWVFVFSSVLFAERITTAEPAGIRMLLIIVVLLWAMKSVVLLESRANLRFSNWLVFCTLWFGMRPSIFASSKSGATKRHLEYRLYIWNGIVRLALGALLVFAASAVWDGELTSQHAKYSWQVWCSTALLLPGLSLLLHFGCFLMLTGFWRFVGFKVSPLFRSPLLSRTLSEFWGKRWNLAFSEMTAISIFRPVKELLRNKSWGQGTAVTTAFVFSGLLHELAISVPVLDGFGWPTLYFALHGLAMVIEDRLAVGGIDMQGSSVLGRVWTMAWILIPLPLLFHTPFLEGCVWPLLGYIRLLYLA